MWFLSVLHFKCLDENAVNEELFNVCEIDLVLQYITTIMLLWYIFQI